MFLYVYFRTYREPFLLWSAKGLHTSQLSVKMEIIQKLKHEAQVAVSWGRALVRTKVGGLVCVAGTSRQYTENH